MERGIAHRDAAKSNRRQPRFVGKAKAIGNYKHREKQRRFHEKNRAKKQKKRLTNREKTQNKEEKKNLMRDVGTDIVCKNG